jgi:uracil DNA glycosylase
MSTQEIVVKIKEKLKKSGWYDDLRIFLESSDFGGIVDELRKKVEVDNQRFCPNLGKAFRFMEEVPSKKIKAVLFLDYIPNRLQFSDGISLTSPSDIVDSIQIDIIRSAGFPKMHIIDKWIEQGLFIMPLALTTRIEGKPHKKIWEPFIMRLIEVINKKHPNIPWVLLGSDTWKYEEDIDSNYIKKIELKTPLAERDWANWIDECLSIQNKTSINWLT